MKKCFKYTRIDGFKIPFYLFSFKCSYENHWRLISSEVTFPYFKEICWRGWRRNLCLKCRAAIAAVIFEWAAKTHSLLCFSCCLHLLLFAKLPSFLPSFHGTSSHTTRVLFKNIWSLSMRGILGTYWRFHAWGPIVNRSVGAGLAAFVFLSIFTMVLNVSSYF
jgi:hypothetical protein